MTNQNPLLGFLANPKSPELTTWIQGFCWPLPLRKGFSDYISTIVLGFPELRKQWERQTKGDPIEQSCPSPAMEFLPVSAFIPPVSGKLLKFHCTGYFQNTKQITKQFFGLGEMKI